MAIVAGLFDTQSDATEAMDRLLRMNIDDLDTHVIEPGQFSDTSETGMITPTAPYAGGPGAGSSGPAGPMFIPVSGMGGSIDWLDNLDEVERVFYQEGLREGATLALAKVDDEHAEQVRQLFRAKGARTYVKD